MNRAEKRRTLAAFPSLLQGPHKGVEMWHLVERNKDLFIETKNPLYAWKALEHALILSTHPHYKEYPIPDEILDYLRKAAHELIKVAQNPPEPAQRPHAIAKAFKLHKTGAGQGSAFTDYSKRLNDREIALATAEKLEFYGPDKADYAFDDIAVEYEISKSTARRNFLAHSERWHLMAERLIESGNVIYQPDGKVFLNIKIYGDADDLRESAEILKIIEEIGRNKESS